MPNVDIQNISVRSRGQKCTVNRSPVCYYLYNVYVNHNSILSCLGCDIPITTLLL